MTGPSPLAVRLIGGPTALIELGGVRILTDPTFDPPGPHPIGSRALTKTAPPAIGAEELGRVDLVLLSHDQHPDNLDDAGRAVLAAAPLAYTTPLAASRLGAPAVGLAPWTYADVPRPDGGTLRVAAVPAQHGPDGSEASVGPVTGFVLSGEGLPTVYVSGDNASLRVVAEVAHNAGPVDVALLFAGAARTELLDAYLTLTSEQAAEAARILGARAVIPLHTEGWAHFRQGPSSVAEAFVAAELADTLVLLAPGESTVV